MLCIVPFTRSTAPLLFGLYVIVILYDIANSNKHFSNIEDLNSSSLSDKVLVDAEVIC